jgi:hypothetical protein
MRGSRQQVTELTRPGVACVNGTSHSPLMVREKPPPGLEPGTLHYE